MRALMKFSHLKFLLPIAYVLGAALVWWDFSQTPPDGLANVGIALYTLPIVLFARLLTNAEFPYFDGGGYYQDHAAYFLTSVSIIAVGLFVLLYGLEMFRNKRSAEMK